MNKLCTTLLLLFLVSTVSAQKIHFTDTSNVWEGFENLYNESGPALYVHYTYSFIKDTAIHAVAYKIFSFGIVREDTAERKVYIYNGEYDTDIVLLDYNLNIGDTFTDAGFHFKFVVSGIDSTLINGVWHKVWHFPEVVDPATSDFNYRSDIVEGIGCLHHPAYMLMDGGVEPPDYEVYCFSNNSATPALHPAVGPFDNSTSCSTLTHLSTNNFTAGLNQLHIYPNPAAADLHIEAGYKITELAIYDLSGQILYKRSCNSEKADVNTRKLPAGAYLIKINNQFVRRFIKQ